MGGREEEWRTIRVLINTIQYQIKDEMWGDDEEQIWCSSLARRPKQSPVCWEYESGPTKPKERSRQRGRREREEAMNTKHLFVRYNATFACKLTTINSKLISFSQSWAIARWVVRLYWLVSQIRLQLSSSSSSSTTFFPFLFSSFTGGMKSSSSIMSSKKYSEEKQPNLKVTGTVQVQSKTGYWKAYLLRERDGLQPPELDSY